MFLIGTSQDLTPSPDDVIVRGVKAGGLDGESSSKTHREIG